MNKVFIKIYQNVGGVGRATCVTKAAGTFHTTFSNTKRDAGFNGNVIDDNYKQTFVSMCLQSIQKHFLEQTEINFTTNIQFKADEGRCRGARGGIHLKLISRSSVSWSRGCLKMAESVMLSEARGCRKTNFLKLFFSNTILSWKASTKFVIHDKSRPSPWHFSSKHLSRLNFALRG